ncbi:hypothetical protein GEMRC1_000767 [Eukaryota sp. GEM-RC1]
MIQANQWTPNSGKLPNPGKYYFLQLTSETIQKVNVMKDKNGVNYARKAMIRCGMSKDVTGVWHEHQLSVDLQEIVKKHRSYFEQAQMDEEQEQVIDDVIQLD